MEKLKRDDLYSLEKYSELRSAYREKVIKHKSKRILQLGDSAFFYFEDRLTMQYQVQEMLRVEKIFDAKGIEEELTTYNSLIPDGTNWKATFMLQYGDNEIRDKELQKLKGIEDMIRVQVEGHDAVYAIADEDIERENSEKTASVHFLRFEFTKEMIQTMKDNGKISMGISHEHYKVESINLDKELLESLISDLD